MKKRFFLSSTAPSVSQIIPVFLLLLLVVSAAPGQTPFMQDSAYAFLNVIAGDIGPRPMGSPNERAAMEYALAKFREFGLQEAFILPMHEAVAAMQGGVNTNSGIAVGVLRGKSTRTILIGGHIDSAGPEIPGANDDGSGAATVIELARVLSHRNNESTIVFALFGGEEEGLRGSWYFAKNFDRMADIKLMLQVDMDNGSDWLLPLVRSKNHMTPKWLVKASYEEMEATGHEGLSYPTHFYSFLEATPGGGIGSDYEPFLEQGIAAIDFTSDVNDPIHTPEDNLANFIPGGLKRSGDLVYRLVERFDHGVPEGASDFYYLVQLGGLLLFFPLWSLWAFIVLSIGLAAAVLLRMRNRRTPEEQRKRIPGLKLFLLMLIIQTCVWMSETVVGLIKGDRFPWMSSLTGYFVLGFLAALLGIWFAMRLAPSLGFSKDAYRYALRTISFLVIYIVLMAFRSPLLALYPAIGLFILALSFVAEQWYLKLLLWLIAPHFLFRLVFSEGFGLMAHALSGIPGDNAMISIWTTIIYILLFGTLSFPFLLAFAAIRFQKPESFAFLSRVKTASGGAVLALGFLGCVTYLSLQPTYSAAWQQLITVSERVDLDAGTGSTEISSMDYLDGTVIRTARGDSSIVNHVRRVQLADFSPDDSWITTDRTVEARADSPKRFSILLKLRTKYRPYKLTIRYSGGESTPRDVETPFVWSPEQNAISLRWYAFQDSVLVIPLALSTVHSDTLRETIEATFVRPMVPVAVRRGQADVAFRTVVTRSTLLGGRD